MNGRNGYIALLGRFFNIYILRIPLLSCAKQTRNRQTKTHRFVLADIKSQTQMKVGWYTTGALFVAAFLGPAPMGSINYEYNAYHAAIYAALGPMAWCGLFAWIVFTSHLGYTSEFYPELTAHYLFSVCGIKFQEQRWAKLCIITHSILGFSLICNFTILGHTYHISTLNVV